MSTAAPPASVQTPTKGAAVPTENDTPASDDATPCACSDAAIAPTVVEDDDGNPCGRYCGTCGGGLDPVGPLEVAYDEHFSPLVSQLIALSKEHGVSLFVHCVLDGAPDSVTTCVPAYGDGDIGRGLLRVVRPPATWAAITVFSGAGDS